MEELRRAIKAVLAEQQLAPTSLRRQQMHEAGEKLLKSSPSENVQSCAMNIVQSISKCIAKTSSSFSIHSLREKAQTAFHRVRMEELPSPWKHLLEASSICLRDPLLMQSVNQKVFDRLLVDSVSSCQSQAPTAATVPLSLTIEEENALRYSAGYVPFKLLKKYEGESTEKGLLFSECLQSMESAGDYEHHHHAHDYTFNDYTSAWLKKVDRGVLFCISDATYKLFFFIELKTRVILTAQLTKQSLDKDGVVSAIASNEDVQLQWNSISSAISSEILSESLLLEMVTLWVTMRGFSMCSAWLDEYKQAQSVKTKKEGEEFPEISVF